ncbi:hypothetical protein J7E73_14615 [Paenibacillus albidus]|nr:hypothetical protein [Paenibacillus albidus]MBT2290351.1 hypothetical protein [Paenibacillus albidus]
MTPWPLVLQMLVAGVTQSGLQEYGGGFPLAGIGFPEAPGWDKEPLDCI